MSFESRFSSNKQPYLRLVFVSLGILLIPLPLQAQTQADVRSGMFAGKVDVGVAGSNSKDKKSARKSFNPYSTNQYYTANDEKKMASKSKSAKAPTLGPILEAQQPRVATKIEKKQDVKDTFAIPEGEAKAAAKFKDSLDIGMFERTLPKGLSRSEQKLRRSIRADKKVKTILKTIEAVTGGLAKAGMSPGDVRHGNIAEALDAIRSQAESAANPEIEREEKARSNRF